ncbi:unnamed protein product [Microthlaspi erraticum]|uniref:Uncharacterized protein n=1 Tax=Microthlaspi erraticum TaxID=1685480 RepID=A0A6D2J8J5_9BRAS|nr:unnamed protein product [Microthlaspi erraticum]
MEHIGGEEHGGTWCMDAAQLDTQRKKEEAILKTSSTVYSTNRLSSLTRPTSFNSIELRSFTKLLDLCKCTDRGSMGIEHKDWLLSTL